MVSVSTVSHLPRNFDLAFNLVDDLSQVELLRSQGRKEEDVPPVFWEGINHGQHVSLWRNGIKVMEVERNGRVVDYRRQWGLGNVENLNPWDISLGMEKEIPASY